MKNILKIMNVANKRMSRQYDAMNGNNVMRNKMINTFSIAVGASFKNHQQSFDIAVKNCTTTNNKDTYGKVAIGLVAAGLTTGIAFSDEREVGNNKNSPNCPIDSARYPELAKFAKKHSGSIDAARDIYKKGLEIDRIDNADRMKKVIATYKLDHLGVAQKYLSCTGTGQCDVIAEGVVEAKQDDSFFFWKKEKLLSLIEVQQLVKFVEETGFRDWGRADPNLLRDDKGKLIFIDTENSSFFRQHSDEKLPKPCKAVYVLNLGHYYYSQMEPEAQKWFQEKVDELSKSPEGVAEYKPLHVNKQYEAPEYDLIKVKTELANFIEEEPIRTLSETGICKNHHFRLGMGRYNYVTPTIEESQKIRDAIMQAKRNGKKIDLSGSNCTILDLSDMDLSDIDFIEITGFDMKISGSNIAGANFSRARLWKSEMFNVKGLDTANFFGARYIKDIQTDHQTRRAIMKKSGVAP